MIKTDTFLLCASIAFAVANNILLHARKADESPKNDRLFNALNAAVWIVILIALNGFRLTLSFGVVVFGTLYGLCQTAFLFFKTKALETGDIAVTTLIGNSSMVVSTLLGVLIWQEVITLWQGVGVVLLCVTLLLCLKVSGDAHFEKAWKGYVVLFFVCASGVGLIFKIFSKTVGSEHAGDMMVFAAVVMLFGNGVPAVLCRKTQPLQLSKREGAFGVLCGLVSCAYNRLNIYLSGALPSIIFFPVFNGAVFILAVLAGAILFKERISRRQAIAFVLDGVGLLCISNLF